MTIKNRINALEKKKRFYDEPLIIEIISSYLKKCNKTNFDNCPIIEQCNKDQSWPLVIIRRIDCPTCAGGGLNATGYN